MAVSHEYMLQAEKLLQQALVTLGAAQNAVSEAIATDTMIPPGDPNSSYWGTLQTAIATAITDVNTAIGDVYYSPEQNHS